MDDEVLALALATAYPEEIERADPGIPLEEVRGLLNAVGRGEASPGAVRELLDERIRLREWVAKVLEDPRRRPPHLQPGGHRGLENLPGQAVPAAESYVCDAHGFLWYRMSVTASVPVCPIGGEPLTAS